MININNLTKDDVGRWVYYTDSFDGRKQYGRLKSWNEVNVFVVYESLAKDMNLYMHYIGVATDPKDLTFV